MGYLFNSISLFPGVAKADENISSNQKAVNHLATVAIENFTTIAGFHWRYSYHMQEFYDKLLVPNYNNNWSLKVFKALQPRGMLLRTNLHGIGRHSQEEIAQFSFQDLDALSELLGDKPFFSGKNPGAVDCTMFGHLVQFVYIPMDIPQKAYIKEKCPNLAEFVDRMRILLWPDWEEMCLGNCMEGKKALDLANVK